jgi:hypothetical protein
MCCGISKLQLHLQTDMKHTCLLLDVLNEGVYSAIILNLFKAMQNSCFLAHSKHACNFQRHQESMCEIHYIRPAYRFSFIYK